MFSSINKAFGCCSKILGCSNKKIFLVPNFVAVAKPFFSGYSQNRHVSNRVPQERTVPTQNVIKPSRFKPHVMETKRERVFHKVG